MVSITSDDFAVGQKAPAIASVEVVPGKRELRVLQVFSILSVGGAETWLMSLLKYFREAEAELPVRVKLDILLTGGEKAVFDDEAVSLGARLFYVPFTRANSVRFIREFRRILSRGNYDAIHDHQDYIAGLHFLLGLGHLPPVRIAHVHNPLYQRAHQANGPVRRAANSVGKYLLSGLATNIMGTSRQIVTEYGFNDSGFRKVALGAAHCGFDVKQYQSDYQNSHAELCRELGWNDSSKIILFVGRLEADEVFHLGRTMTHKNPAFALDVARECMARDKRVRLAMVGAGETKRREFEELIKEWGLDQNIRMLGVRSDVSRLMLGSDLLLFPSLAEGLGMVTVEAQAAGLRVLASDTTPRESVVVPEIIDFLSLSAGPESWARKALRLINLPRHDSAQCNAAVRNSPFSIQSSATKLLSTYTGEG